MMLLRLAGPRGARRPFRALFLCLTLAACASGDAGDVITSRGDGGPGRDGGPAPRSDGGAGGVDVDGDGVPADRDCDDLDPGVGAIGERSCSSACGRGVEQCFDGSWTACTAPTDCDCTAGEAPRMVPCERCGLQRQVCSGGTWVDDGACSSGECSPGTMETGGSCGSCGSQHRACQSDCSWGAWSCSGEGVCSAGEIGMDSESCGECGEGLRSRTRTCLSSCSWGAWGGFGTCSTSAQCSPGETQPETGTCTGACGGTRTRTRSCDSSTCRWGSFGAWSTCPSSCCGDGICGAGESCSTCTDCQAGHLGTGNNGDPCPGVPAEQWRCVTILSFGTMGSQVCRSGAWVTYHLNPRDCANCKCSYSSACSAP